MGKKRREERRREHEDFAVKNKKIKRKNSLLATGILGAVFAVVGYSIFIFMTAGVDAPGAPDGAGLLGGEHEHASLLVKIFGDKFDFSVPNYQIKSSWIHFEESDGTTVHRHASGIKLGYLFDGLKIGIDSECFVFPDGRQFCTNEDYSLRYFINHQQIDDIRDYVFEDGDRILILYGNESSEQVEAYLLELDSQLIKG
jgi:hypothetical protein